MFPLEGGRRRRCDVKMLKITGYLWFSRCILSSILSAYMNLHQESSVSAAD